MKKFGAGADRNGRDSKKRRPKKAKIQLKKRACRFCADNKLTIDYKNGKILLPFLAERGRILPRRISGNCAQHQKDINLAVKRARVMALLSFCATQERDMA